VLERLHLDVSPSRIVRTLPIDQQQMIEIARAISMEAHTVILDEPTSALTEDQVEALFAVVRKMRSESISTLFVSHRLAEVFAVTDRTTVFRDGKTVASGPTSDFTRDSMIEAMVGHPVPPSAPGRSRPSAGEPVLRADCARCRDEVGPISLDVSPGETIGVAGLVGSGRSALLQVLAGYSDLSEGTVTFEGRSVRQLTPAGAMARGIAFIPSDRKTEGLVLIAGVGENLSMVQSATSSRFALPRRNAAQQAETVDRYRIKAPSLEAPVSALSGGNQQKVMLAKWMRCDPRLILLDEPTRGVDVGSKADIYRLIEEAADRGAAVIVSSSENDELREATDAAIAASAMGADAKVA